MYIEMKREHDRIRSLLDEIGHLIRGDGPPPCGRLARLRWTLVREHMVHSRRERAVIDTSPCKQSSAGAHRCENDQLEELVLCQVKRWNEAAIGAEWQTYRAETSNLAHRLRTQMREEERAFSQDEHRLRVAQRSCTTGFRLAGAACAG